MNGGEPRDGGGTERPGMPQSMGVTQRQTLLMTSNTHEKRI